MANKAELLSIDGKVKRAVDLPDGIFSSKVSEGVIYQAVVAHRANSRQGTASTKTKAEVSGSGSKPWRQKGTGRARVGSARSPLWEGGGIIFGPKPRSYATSLPKKTKRLARLSALTLKAQNGRVKLIEQLSFDKPKTTRLVSILKNLNLDDKKVLILTDGYSGALYKSGRNIPRVQVKRFVDASTYDILWADILLIEESAFLSGQVDSSVQSEANDKPEDASALEEVSDNA